MLKRISPMAIALLCSAMWVAAGCNHAPTPPPVGMLHPAPPPPMENPNKTWTLQEKIDVIEKSGMPKMQKDQEIANLRAHGG